MRCLLPRRAIPCQGSPSTCLRRERSPTACYYSRKRSKTGGQSVFMPKILLGASTAKPVQIANSANVSRPHLGTFQEPQFRPSSTPNSKSRDQLYGVAYRDVAWHDHRAIESEPAVEFLLNSPQDADILLARIRVESSHDATCPQISYPDDCRTDSQVTPFP